MIDGVWLGRGVGRVEVRSQGIGHFLAHVHSRAE